MTDVQHFVSGIPFEKREWWEDPNCIAELYEWMARSGAQPLNVSHFIRHAYDWEPHYRYMRSEQQRLVMLEQAKANPRACTDAPKGTDAQNAS